MKVQNDFGPNVNYHASMKKINAVFALRRITKDGVASLTPMEADVLYERINQTYYSLEGEERDIFVWKIGPLLRANTSREWWKINHAEITAAVEKHLCETGRMPTKIVLSRQTITKHLKRNTTLATLPAQVRKLKAEMSRTLPNLCTRALAGDAEAARSFFALLDGLKR